MKYFVVENWITKLFHFWREYILRNEKISHQPDSMSCLPDFGKAYFVTLIHRAVWNLVVPSNISSHTQFTLQFNSCSLNFPLPPDHLYDTIHEQFRSATIVFPRSLNTKSWNYPMEDYFFIFIDLKSTEKSILSFWYFDLHN